jgi:hypothetical protein
MQVLFESRDSGGEQVRPLAVDRVRFALRRLSWLVPRVRVRLSDVNGPRGGVDKRCRIEVDGAAPVHVTALARDWRGAIDQAVARAARALLRAWRRVQHRNRASRPQVRLGPAGPGVRNHAL